MNWLYDLEQSFYSPVPPYFGFSLPYVLCLILVHCNAHQYNSPRSWIFYFHTILPVYMLAHLDWSLIFEQPLTTRKISSPNPLFQVHWSSNNFRRAIEWQVVLPHTLIPYIRTLSRRTTSFETHKYTLNESPATSFWCMYLYAVVLREEAIYNKQDYMLPEWRSHITLTRSVLDVRCTVVL